MRCPLSQQEPESLLTHAALAILSDCYSPRKGRLSTCYSPVRRFTRELPLFLARLACVKPAANVRSEPGSNSPIKVFDLLIESPVRLPQQKTQSSGVLLFVARFPLYSVFKDRLAWPLPAKEPKSIQTAESVNFFLRFFLPSRLLFSGLLRPAIRGQGGESTHSKRAVNKFWNSFLFSHTFLPIARCDRRELGPYPMIERQSKTTSTLALASAWTVVHVAGQRLTRSFSM